MILTCETAVLARINNCEVRVPLDRVDEFQRSFPHANLVCATEQPSVSVCWEFWRAGYERSYHGEPGVVWLDEIEVDDVR
jgi:hypothetical protein